MTNREEASQRLSVADALLQEGKINEAVEVLEELAAWFSSQKLQAVHFLTCSVLLDASTTR